MKLRSLAVSLAALALASGAALAQTAPAAAPAAPAAAPAAAGPTDKALLSYALGYDMAGDMVDRKVDLDLTNLIRGIQDAYAKKPPAMDPQKLAASLSAFQKRMVEQARADLEKATRENKAKGDAFLAANKAKPGVTTLPSGVQYRIIDAGTGAKPTATSTLSVHVRGSAVNGQEFMSSYSNNEPATIKLSEFPIEGVKEVLLLMQPGARWEIFVPAAKAYGNDPRSPVGPGAAAIFDIKLISIK